jgi:hypothetical protein
LLLCEQERILTAEQNLMKNYGVYSTSSTSLATIHDYGNITVPGGGALIYVSAGVQVATLNANGWADFVLQIASAGAIAGKHLIVSGSSVAVSDYMGCIIALAAGTYDVKVLGRADNAATTAQVFWISVGITNFNDLFISNYSSVTSGTMTISNAQVNNRTLPVGSLNQAVAAVNVGTNGVLGTSLTVSFDGVSQTVPDEDAGINGCGFNVYKFYSPLSVGSAHTITITVTSGVTAWVSVVMTPWILTSGGDRHGHQPVTLNFTQNSTLNAHLGSLYYDTTKNAYIGAVKGVSFAASDYYAQSIIGNGVLPFSYTFTSISVSGTPFVVDGLGGCIESIGVDVA